MVQYDGFITRLVDCNGLERKRGMMIWFKCTSGNLINIVDTPGHADFGGGVERIMSVVNDVALLRTHDLSQCSKSRLRAWAAEAPRPNA